MYAEQMAKFPSGTYVSVARIQNWIDQIQFILYLTKELISPQRAEPGDPGHLLRTGHLNED